MELLYIISALLVLSIISVVVLATQVTKFKQVAAETLSEHNVYHALATSAIDEAEKRVASLEKEVKSKLDECRRQSDFKLQSFAKQAVSAVSEMKVGKPHKIQAITAINAALQYELTEGFNL